MSVADISRRGLISGLGLLAVSTITAEGSLAEPAAALATAAAPLGPGANGTAVSGEARTIERFIRMRSSPDLSPVMWLYHGVLMGKLEGQLARPLVGVGGMSFTRAVRRAAGVYNWELDEVGYYLDLHSGEVLPQWLNPYTNKLVKPAHYRAPEHMQYSGDGVKSYDPVPPGADFRGEITTLAEVGGVVTMTEDLYVRIPGASATSSAAAAPDRVLASLGSFTAQAAALAAAPSRWVDCQMNYATMNSFARWLGMDGMAGVQNMRLSGAKRPASDLAAIPAWLRARIDAEHPTFLEVPRNWAGQH